MIIVNRVAEKGQKKEKKRKRTNKNKNANKREDADVSTFWGCCKI